MSLNKIDPNAYRNAAYIIWIAHRSGTTNKGSAIVYKWYTESKRLYMFRAAKRLIENYRGESIREVRFYDPNDSYPRPIIGGRDENGKYYGAMEFMNRLNA